MAAAHYKLDNLVVIFDNNGLQIDGNVQDVIGPLPLKEKALAFGTHAVEIDGNDFDEIRSAFKDRVKDKPTVIALREIEEGLITKEFLDKQDRKEHLRDSSVHPADNEFAPIDGVEMFN